MNTFSRLFQQKPRPQLAVSNALVPLTPPVLDLVPISRVDRVPTERGERLERVAAADQDGGRTLRIIINVTVR